MQPYQLLFEKVLSRTDPEKAHHAAFRAIRAARPATGALSRRHRGPTTHLHRDLSAPGAGTKQLRPDDVVIERKRFERKYVAGRKVGGVVSDTETLSRGGIQIEDATPRVGDADKVRRLFREGQELRGDLCPHARVQPVTPHLFRACLQNP